VLAGDPRADPAIVDLIELAGLWLAADDRPALARSLRRLVDLIARGYPSEGEFRDRFERLLRQAEDDGVAADELRRSYRRATLG
jgi:hypothetical protein